MDSRFRGNDKTIVDEGDDDVRETVAENLEYIIDNIRREVELEDWLPIFRKLLIDPPDSVAFRDVILAIEDIDDPIFLPLLREILDSSDLRRREREDIQDIIESLE